MFVRQRAETTPVGTVQPRSVCRNRREPMHRSSQAAASGGRLSPQFPAPPARCGSVATASAGVGAASPQEAVSVGTGEDGHRLSVRRQGLPLSAWPDHLLVLVLRQLTPVELVACRRVCQQWYRVASDPGLRAHTLMASYPPAHRRQLQQALAPDRRASIWPPGLTAWHPNRRAGGRWKAAWPRACPVVIFSSA